MITGRSIPIFLMVLPIVADPLGDFAPLEVGNKWKYYYSSHAYQDGEPLYDSSRVSMNDSSTCAIQVTGMAVNHDTTVYYFHRKRSGIRKTYAINATQPQTESIFQEYDDTLLQVGDSLIIRSTWGSLIPLWRYHYHRGPDTITVNWGEFEYVTDSIKAINGSYEFRETTEKVSITGKRGTSCNTYRADVGLVRCTRSYEELYYPYKYNDTITLLYFSNGTDEYISVKKSAAARSRFTASPVKKTLRLPYVTISRDQKMFNLLGRCGDFSGKHGFKQSFHDPKCDIRSR